MNALKEQELRNDLHKAITKIFDAHYEKGTFEDLYVTDSLVPNAVQSVLNSISERERYFAELELNGIAKS